jgi:UDP:flavonoid glycosyltransferase YjiC (YdhE family)
LGFVWELGTYSGYSTLIGQIAQAAIAQGHECVFIVRDMRAAAPHLPPRLGPMLQAPWTGATPTTHVRVQTSYATLLHNCGFDDSARLASRLRAWIDLYRACGVERLVARHSPTAILAARLQGLPILHYGNGFTMPPDRTPWPSFRPDLKLSPAALLHNESRVLGVVNDALNRFDHPAIAEVRGIFSGLPTLLLGSPELDHYLRAQPLPHIDFPPLGYGAMPEWPAGGDEARLFVPLLPTSAAKGWLELLDRLPARSLVRFPSDAPIHHASDRVKISQGPVDYVAALDACTAVLGYGSHNLAHEALLAGKPMAAIAHTPDHLLLGQRVQSLGAGIVLSERADAASLGQLTAFLADTRFRDAAQGFAERNRRRSAPQDIPAQILEHAFAARPAPL